MYSGGDGTIENPYLVSNADELDMVRNDIYAHYKQIADIDLSGIDWIPIGASNDYDLIDSFYGTYDGGNHKIINLYVDRIYDDYIGLFGDLADGTVMKNMILVDPIVTGDGECGAIAGSSYSTVFENCHIIGGQVTAQWFAGGLTGSDWAWRSPETMPKMVNCSTTCDVTSMYGEAGGLAGWCGENSLIEKCYTTGTITGAEYCGGFFSWAQSNTTIINCYSTSYVRWTDNVSKEGYSHGGLVGWCDNGTEIINCYVGGHVETTDRDKSLHGGIVGEYNYDGDPITNCYYDSDKITYVDNEFGEPRSTDQMKQKDTFIEWDFTNIWSIEDGLTYPYLVSITISSGLLKAFKLNTVFPTIRGE